MRTSLTLSAPFEVRKTDSSLASHEQCNASKDTVQHNFLSKSGRSREWAVQECIAVLCTVHMCVCTLQVPCECICSYWLAIVKLVNTRWCPLTSLRSRRRETGDGVHLKWNPSTLDFRRLTSQRHVSVHTNIKRRRAQKSETVTKGVVPFTVMLFWLGLGALGWRVDLVDTKANAACGDEQQEANTQKGQGHHYLGMAGKVHAWSSPFSSLRLVQAS